MIIVAFALIALAGGVGAVLRYLISSWMGKLPWGILFVNTAAAFIAAAVLSASASDGFMVALVVTGFCGGLSTFSTFSAQTVEYAKNKQVWRGLANLALNFLLPTLAALAGIYLAATLLK